MQHNTEHFFHGGSIKGNYAHNLTLILNNIVYDVAILISKYEIMHVPNGAILQKL